LRTRQKVVQATRNTPTHNPLPNPSARDVDAVVKASEKRDEFQRAHGGAAKAPTWP
jgi:hypothetical protein